jgi:hypothetical protein
MRTSPELVTSPAILLAGAAATRLTENLQSVIVHCAKGEASAEVRVIHLLLQEIGPLVELHETKLVVQFGNELIFAGDLTQVDRLVPDGAPPSLILHATGGAREDRASKAVQLRHGAELLSCTVTRQGEYSTARGTTSMLALREGLPVDLTTGDPYFDGRFTISEVSYRFDGTLGLRVEFLAVA